MVVVVAAAALVVVVVSTLLLLCLVVLVVPQLQTHVGRLVDGIRHRWPLTPSSRVRFWAQAAADGVPPPPPSRRL
jgi:predicted PurR-regulated permease PerM